MSPQQLLTKPQSLADLRAEDALHFRRVLLEVIEIGADLMRLVHHQAKAEAATPKAATTIEPAPEVAPEIAPEATQGPSSAYERLSRAVRRNMMLAQKMVEPVAPAADHAASHRTTARRRIIREVEDTIQRDAHGAEAESLHADLLDRLDGPDLDDDIENRPVADIIADICRDFGLDLFPGTHPWKLRTAADVAALCARAAEPSRAAPIAPLAMPPRKHSGGDPAINRAQAETTRLPGSNLVAASDDFAARIPP